MNTGISQLRAAGWTCATAALLVLAACGTDSPTATISTSTARGTLMENPPLRIAAVDAATLTAQLNASASGQQLMQIVGKPTCGVDFNYMHYWTVGGANESVTASGALMVPTGAAPACSGPRPIVLYAHPTDPDKNHNMADITDPTNQYGALAAAAFAAHGYIVVAPNYTGYDTSSLSYHPFLNAVAQSSDMIDALAAGRSALGKILAASTTDNGKLFITGYSQGGYVAMATQQAMQKLGMTVTAASPMSGPYALEATIDAAFYGDVGGGATEFAPLLTTSYQKSYGNVYKATTDVFEANYAPTIEGLLPSATPLDQIVQSGKLPAQVLFNSTTPVTGNAMLDAALAVPANPLFAAGFGPSNLITNAYRVAYILDTVASPDGVVPAPTTLLPATSPALGFRQDLQLNDLRGFVPTAPVLMCGGSQDPVIIYQINTQIMATLLSAQVQAHLVTVLDLETVPTATDPFATAEGGFQMAKAAIAAAAGGGAAGQLAVVQAYHSAEAPFCSAAAAAFFSQF